jgi:hypothetical protein
LLLKKVFFVMGGLLRLEGFTETFLSGRVRGQSLGLWCSEPFLAFLPVFVVFAMPLIFFYSGLLGTGLEY